MSEQSTASETVRAIQAGGAAREEALRKVYLANRTAIGRMVQKAGGTDADAQDVMQEAMLAFFENVRSGAFRGESKVATYLYAIARFNWLNQRKKRERRREKEQLAAPLPGSKVTRLSLESGLGLARMTELFARLGENCQRVLLDSIYYGSDMQKIAKNMGYENEQVARNKKYTCLKKLKTLIREHPHLLDWLSNN
ncbi:MAG: sigma-70 family RNA polymerase sigma factor [Bacteroidota bacterium]